MGSVWVWLLAGAVIWNIQVWHFSWFSKIQSHMKFVYNSMAESKLLVQLNFENSSYSIMCSVYFVYSIWYNCKPCPHSGISSCCRRSLHTFISQYNSTLATWLCCFYIEGVWIRYFITIAILHMVMHTYLCL